MLSKLTSEMSTLSAQVPRQHEDLPRNRTQTGHKDNPETTLSNDMGHEGIVQILLFILDCSPSETVLECVKVTELISARVGGV